MRHTIGRVGWTLAIAGALVLGVTAGSPVAGALTLVSVGPGGVPGNDESTDGVITPDGRFVVFVSDATNLTPDCPAGGVFRRDLVAGDTVCVVSDHAVFALVVSPDGNRVAFQSFTTHGPCVGGSTSHHIFLRDIAAATTTCLSVNGGGDPENSSSAGPAMSRDGRFVAFDSLATNLSPACTNANHSIVDTRGHVYVRDLGAGTVTCVSVDDAGVQGDGYSTGPAISEDGRLVAFQSNAANLDPACAAGTVQQIYLRDTVAGTTRCVSLGVGGAPAAGDAIGPSLSADGRLVLFVSKASNLDPRCANGKIQVFVRDTVAGVTRCESVSPFLVAADADAEDGALSPDGRWVAYLSNAENLHPVCKDGFNVHVFLRDRVGGTVRCLDIGASGQPGETFISFGKPSVSDDGRFVAFEAEGALLPGVGEDSRHVYRAEVPAASTLTTRLNATTFGPGDTLVLDGVLTAGTAGPLDAYVVLRLPDGSLLSLTLGGLLVPGVVPIAAGLTPFDLTQELLQYTFTGGEPAGDYAWLSGLTATGVLVDVVAGVAEQVFTVAR